jgi:hypothetical protein
MAVFIVNIPTTCCFSQVFRISWFVEFTRYGDTDPSDGRNRVGLTQLGPTADGIRAIFRNTTLFNQNDGKRPIYMFRFNKFLSLQISKEMHVIVANPYCVKGLCELSPAGHVFLFGIYSCTIFSPGRNPIAPCGASVSVYSTDEEREGTV